MPTHWYKLSQNKNSLRYRKKTCNLSLTCNKAVNLNVEWSLLDVLSLIHKDRKNMVLEKTLE